ncbi:MAG: GNAT family N-acetyltransferase [Fimbriimonadales bacterium]|nr:GNAT family N-acetyltransferase [Fimbriimonadales bacterium]
MELRAGVPSDWPTSVIPWLGEALPREGIDAGKFARQVLCDPNFDPAGLIVAYEASKPIGLAWAAHRSVPLENAPPDSDRGYVVLLAVHPEHRRKGVGTELLSAAERYLRVRGARTAWVCGYAPGYFLPGVDLAYAGAPEFFERNGYSEVYRPLAMQAPLWDLSTPVWVAERRRILEAQGIRFQSFEPELAWPALEFARAHFAGDWVRWVKEAIRDITLGDDPSRLVFAWRDGARPEVLGFSHYLGERFGPIGVRSSERGRGIGQVLLYETLHAQKARGLRCSWFLWSDDPTAARLYEAAGFEEIRRFSYLKKEL